MNATPWAENETEFDNGLGLGVIYGYKALKVVERGQTYCLQSPNRRVNWSVGEPLEAGCVHMQNAWYEKRIHYKYSSAPTKYPAKYIGADPYPNFPGHKRIPDLGCSCGIYVGKTRGAIADWCTKEDVACCVVEIFGHIIEGKIGYRAAKARIRGLVSPANIPEKRLVQVARQYEAKVILPWMHKFDSMQDILAY